jgi:hypothetical protein
MIAVYSSDSSDVARRILPCRARATCESRPHPARPRRVHPLTIERRAPRHVACTLAPAMTWQRLCYLALLVTTVACAPSPEGERQSKLHEEVASFVYRKPKELVRAEVTRLLAEHGHTLPPGAEETPWKTIGARQEQFVVRFIDLEKGGTFVHIVSLNKHEDGSVLRHRHGDLEWELIQRAEPDRSLEMSNRASKRGEEVHRRRR